MDKKINDLLSLCFILVPIDVTNLYEEVPPHLIKNMTPEQILRSHLITLIIIHDSINKILGNDNELIKSKRFPLEVGSFKLNRGKEY